MCSKILSVMFACFLCKRKKEGRVDHKDASKKKKKNRKIPKGYETLNEDDENLNVNEGGNSKWNPGDGVQPEPMTTTSVQFSGAVNNSGHVSDKSLPKDWTVFSDPMPFGSPVGGTVASIPKVAPPDSKIRRKWRGWNCGRAEMPNSCWNIPRTAINKLPPVTIEVAKQVMEVLTRKDEQGLPDDTEEFMLVHNILCGVLLKDDQIDDS